VRQSSREGIENMPDIGPAAVTLASVFAVIAGIYRFRVWLWDRIKRLIDMWRTRKQMLADVKALQEQVAIPGARAMSGHNAPP
jgi:hypothetical protein